MTSNANLSPVATNTSRPSFFRSLSSSSTTATLSSLSLSRDKPRLYLALYAKGGSTSGSNYNANVTCDSYHWAFIVGPRTAARTDPGTCYQLLHLHNGSCYDEMDLANQSPSQSQTLLVRITIAKVVDENKLRTILRNLPMHTPNSASGSESVSSLSSESDYGATSTCLTWLRLAYKHIMSDPSKPLKGYVGADDWAAIEARARKYVKTKRTQGRFGGNQVDPEYRHWHENEVATWNFWENRETTA